MKNSNNKTQAEEKQTQETTMKKTTTCNKTILTDEHEKQTQGSIIEVKQTWPSFLTGNNNDQEVVIEVKQTWPDFLTGNNDQEIVIEVKQTWPLRDFWSDFDTVRGQVVNGLSDSLENEFVIENKTSSKVISEMTEDDADCDVDRSCPICFEEILEGCDEAFLPCYSHPFHGDCLREWRETCNACPICRSDKCITC